MFSAIASWFKSIFEQIATWFIDIFFLIIGWLWDAFMFLLDSLGLADQMRTSASAFDNIPDSVWYFMNMFQIQFGLGVVLVAYLIRFMIRRIPVIG